MNENELILPSSRLVRASMGTRIHPPCYATSRQIFLCFNEKRFA